MKGFGKFKSKTRVEARDLNKLSCVKHANGNQNNSDLWRVGISCLISHSVSDVMGAFQWSTHNTLYILKQCIIVDTILPYSAITWIVQGDFVSKHISVHWIIVVDGLNCFSDYWLKHINIERLTLRNEKQYCDVLPHRFGRSFGLKMPQAYRKFTSLV